MIQNEKHLEESGCFLFKKQLTRVLSNSYLIKIGGFMEENRGYFYYTIEEGDTIYKLANEFGTSVDRIIVANSGIQIFNLNIDDKIVIPTGDIVDLNNEYNSEMLSRAVESFNKIYPFIETFEIGKSVLEKPIICFKIGSGTKEVFYSAAIHANEVITTSVLLKFLEDYAKAYVEKGTIDGELASALYYNTTLYVVPMVNPDGADLVTGSLSNVDSAYQKAENLAKNYPDVPFPRGWKANINGIDLNLQFPAGWEEARRIKFERGYSKPGPREYVGEGPLTEPEALAIYNFTLQHNFRLVIAYHTQGEVIYWQFQNYNPLMAKEIGNIFSKSSGYPLADTPYGSSFAGYKDWFIQNYNRPGYTIEAGKGSNPLPIEQIYKIYQNNIGILVNGLIV